eukprot:745755-Hanusia_phi.AAC.2
MPISLGFGMRKPSVLLLLCFLAPATASNVTCPLFEVASSLIAVSTSAGCTLKLDVNFYVQQSETAQFYPSSVTMTHNVVQGGSVPILQSTEFASIPPGTQDFTQVDNYVSQVVWTPELRHSARIYDLRVFVPTCDTQAVLAVTVKKCRICLKEDETLGIIASRYNRHWTQIWSVNPSLLSPDKISAGNEISLGNIYSTSEGDTLMLLSGIRDCRHSADTSVCIIPETCPEFRARVAGITW